MLNNILNIEGVSLLPKEQQKAINGGGEVCDIECYCGSLEIVIQHAWNTGNAEQGELAIGYWDQYCKDTYGPF